MDKTQRTFPQSDSKIFGSYTEELYRVFAEPDRMKPSKLRRAFNDLGLFPSHSQIQEMVQFVHCRSILEGLDVTFGEFCVLVDELQHYYKILETEELARGRNVLVDFIETNGIPVHAEMPKSFIWAKRSSSPSSSSGSTAERVSPKGGLANPQVFLGGACGSTVWRKDKAIPFLEKEDITFYNPQVDNWSPELEELENKAKCGAELLFFVIDNMTRGVTSLCEIAYLVGSRRKIIVVFSGGVDADVETVGSEKLSILETEELARGRNVLVDFIETNGIPVFENIDTALECTAQHLKRGIDINQFASQHDVPVVKYGHAVVGKAVFNLRESFKSITSNSVKNGKMSREDIGLGYRCYTGEVFSSSWLQQVAPERSEFSFGEFCSIVTEFKRKHPPPASKIVTKLVSPFTSVQGSPSSPEESSHGVYDIYLGGSCSEKPNWRETVAIPRLKEVTGLSFINPLVARIMSERVSQNLIPMQVAEREQCRILFYVIADGTRAVPAMAEAAYYIGLGCRVALCLEKLSREKPVTGETEPMTEAAFNDYSRCRDYLRAMATREGQPVYGAVSESVSQVVRWALKLDVPWL